MFIISMTWTETSQLGIVTKEVAYKAEVGFCFDKTEADKMGLKRANLVAQNLSANTKYFDDRCNYNIKISNINIIRA